MTIDCKAQVLFSLEPIVYLFW